MFPLGTQSQDTIPFMEVKTITEVVQFSSQKMKKVNLFESPRMFAHLLSGTWTDAGNS